MTKPLTIQAKRYERDKALKFIRASFNRTGRKTRISDLKKAFSDKQVALLIELSGIQSDGVYVWYGYGHHDRDNFFKFKNVLCEQYVNELTQDDIL